MKRSWSTTVILRLVVPVATLVLATLSGAGVSAQAPAASIDPIRLHDALLTHPIEEGQLPPGFTGVRLTDQAVEPENAAMGEVGNIDVTIAAGPDALNGGAYTFYASPEQATAALAQLAQRLGGAQLVGVDPVLSTWPTYVATATLPDPLLGVTAYLIQMDGVVVAAFSGVPGQPAGSADSARDLAVLMAQQVEWLVGADAD